MDVRFCRWPETAGMVDAALWSGAKEITAGVDVGTTGTQVAILADGALLGFASVRTGADFGAAVETAFAKALGTSGAKVSDIGRIAATGFGRKHATGAGKYIDDISCLAKGARFLYGPAVRTVVDMGGQSTKAILLYGWDRVRDFKVNDKCATGMGRHLEMVADILRVPISEMGTKSLEVEHDPEPVSTTCYNFAYPETVGLFRQGYKEDVYHEADVLAAHLFAVAWRILGTVGKLAPLDVGDIKVEEGLGFTGGLAKNAGITKRIERELGQTALTSSYDPQLAGAIGAALLA